MACNYCFPTRTMFKINSEFLKERHVQMRKPYQSPGRMKNSAYYLPRSGIELTTSRTRDNVLNKFSILKERHVQMRKPYQSPGRMKNSSYYIAAPVGD